jgi:hypothetical protein
LAGKKKSRVVNIEFYPALIKRKLRRHLRALGFKKNNKGELEAPGTSKEVIRTLHLSQRTERISLSQSLIKEKLSEYSKYFASGIDINPAKISPRLQRISSSTWETELFRLATLTWSVPVSNGFGRRIRYLVWDDNNGKLIGLIAIGDPVFNLSVRDNLIGWDVHDRSDRLVNIMDAYVLGALPPYSGLLGGKLVACLVRSRDVYDDFANLYGGTTGIISQEEKKARLLAVTTSSSMGRSSVYNRLKLDGTEYFKSIGFSGGWGHFHIPEKLFTDIRHYLRETKHGYADKHSFGEGPNWRLRATRAALSELGYKEDMLRHGIKREVFISYLATNANRILQTGTGKPNLSTLSSVHEISNKSIERWILPRSERMPEFKLWDKEILIASLRNLQSKSGLKKLKMG